MFNAVFLEAYAHHRPHWLLTALSQNDVRLGAPRAPLRLYYGSMDSDVPPSEALRAQRVLAAKGAKVQAISVGPVAHDPSVLAAAPLILAWLKQLDHG